jgi:hypothetical protein
MVVQVKITNWTTHDRVATVITAIILFFRDWFVAFGLIAGWLSNHFHFTTSRITGNDTAINLDRLYD